MVLPHWVIPKLITVTKQHPNPNGMPTHYPAVPVVGKIVGSGKAIRHQQIIKSALQSRLACAGGEIIVGKGQREAGMVWGGTAMLEQGRGSCSDGIQRN